MKYTNIYTILFYYTRFYFACSSLELFDEVLSKVSDYKQPTNESGQLTQGIYALKPDLWKSEFQPLHVMLRGSYKRGYQLAMDKYKGWYQSQNKTKVCV